MKCKIFLLLASVLIVNAVDFNPKTIFKDLNIDIKQHNQWIAQLNQWGVLCQPSRQLPKLDQIPPLYAHHPLLMGIPHISLYQGFTPVQHLQNAGKFLQIPQLFLKNDGFTTGTYTGNKRRKLEFELAQALAHGAQSVITFGCAGSNHAVATSEYCKLLGLQSICMLKPQANSQVVRANLLRHVANNTELHYFPSNDTRKIGTICTWLEHKNNYGNFPYVIPTGGSTPLGTLGFVNAIFELKEQINAGILPEPDLIYVPCGSCATTAGLLLGCKLTGLKTKIMAIAIEPQESPDQFRKNITHLFTAANQLLHETDAHIKLQEITDHDLFINLNFTGSEYAVFTPECVNARELLATYEAITIDGTYTAKAFAALIADAPQLSDKVVLFWDTFCNSPIEKFSVDYKKLPACFHAYFEEDVQELDRLPTSV